MEIRLFHKSLTLDAIGDNKILTAYRLYEAIRRRKIGIKNQIFVNTKEYPKNTKENMPSKTFCSHLSQEGPIN